VSRLDGAMAHDKRGPDVVNFLPRRAFKLRNPRRANMSKLATKQRRHLSKDQFAEPAKRAYPIEDKAHARNAKARASQAVKAGRMAKAEESTIDKKADTVIEQG
jgi:hypothetical protein